MKRIYLDYNASTPLAPTVKEILIRSLNDDWRNPSSGHGEGRKARKAIEDARTRIASLLDCRPDDIIFTSGATESNNALLMGLWETRPRERNKIITTGVEHSSVLKPLEVLKKRGADVVLIPVNRQGEIDRAVFSQALDDKTHMVTIMVANNETGILFPVDELAAEARKKGALFHTDAACGAGKLPLSFKTSGVDALSLSAHKFHGPKGIGAIVLKKEIQFMPPIIGGTHERGRRAGTENISGILGLAEALRFALKDLQAETDRLQRLRTILQEGLRSIDSSVIFHEHPQQQLWGSMNVAFPGASAQILLARLDLEGIAASSGSACHSGALSASHVLTAMGVTEEEAEASIRISFGRMTTEEEIKRVIEIFEKVIPEMR